MAAGRFKERLGRFIHHRYTDLAVVFLILASVALLFYEVAAEPPPPWPTYLYRLDLGITILFILELGIKAYVAPSLRAFLQEYWIDVLAVLPILRPFRFFRILRLARVYRVGIVLSRRVTLLHLILREGATHTVVIGFLLLTIVLFGTLGLIVTERLGVERAAWWSLYTIVASEPVGYEPTSPLGRLVGLVVTLGGLTVFAMFTGLVTAHMVDRLQHRMEVTSMDYFHLKGHIVVCGWSRMGRVLVEELFRDEALRDRSLVVIHARQEPPELDYRTVKRDQVFFLRGDFTRTEVLRKAAIAEASRAVILCDDAGGADERSDQDRDARTILAALTIEKMNPRIHTCAELLNQENEEHLKMAGVEEVIVSAHLGSSLLAHATMTSGISEVFKELLTHGYGNQVYRVPAAPSFEGKPFIDLVGEVKRRHDAILVGFARRREPEGPLRPLLNPEPEERLQPGDDLIVVARRRFQP